MSNHRRAFAVSFVVMGMLALAGPVGAGIVTVPPTAFHPIDAGTTVFWHAQPNAAYAFGIGAAGYSMVAPVYLPNGAVIKKITVFLTDNGASDDDAITVTLVRQNMTDNACGWVGWLSNHSPAPLPHSGVNQSLATTAVAPRTVNNRVYSYSVQITFHPNCTDRVIIRGMKIEY